MLLSGMNPLIEKEDRQMWKLEMRGVISWRNFSSDSLTMLFLFRVHGFTCISGIVNFVSNYGIWKKVYKRFEINMYKLINWYNCIEIIDALGIFQTLEVKHCHFKISS